MSRYWSEVVHGLTPYVPGEQPKLPNLVKLNTNESPYGPSKHVLDALRAEVGDTLRLYPDPGSDKLRAAIAKRHGLTADEVFVGNGSDEVLALATRTFVEPATAKRSSQSTIQYFWPSYSLYPVLADIHGGAKNVVPLKADFSLPSVAELKRGKKWDFSAALTFVTTPNAPSGRGYPTSELDALCAAMKGVVILDEAYVDFADESAAALALKRPHVIVSRTFSKAYSLCFQRVGYFIAHADLVAALDKVRDSYNVNGLGQIAAAATLDDLPYYRKNFRRVIASRTKVTEELTALGFTVLPSQTNFVLARPPKFPAQEWLQKLRDQKIIVRWFSAPEVREYLRITIGSESEMAAFLRVVKRLLKA